MGQLSVRAAAPGPGKARIAGMKPVVRLLCACRREARAAFVPVYLPASAAAIVAALAAPCMAAAPSSASRSPAHAPRLVASQPAPRYPEPLVRHLVTQDRSVRIEEQQVRGATTRIEVQPLHGGARYDIVPPAPTQPEPGSMHGRMQWRIGTFR